MVTLTEKAAGKFGEIVKDIGGTGERMMRVSFRGFG